jgi:hypothetical protein
MVYGCMWSSDSISFVTSKLIEQRHIITTLEIWWLSITLPLPHSIFPPTHKDYNISMGEAHAHRLCVTNYMYWASLSRSCGGGTEYSAWPKARPTHICRSPCLHPGVHTSLEIAVVHLPLGRCMYIAMVKKDRHPFHKLLKRLKACSAHIQLSLSNLVKVKR